MPDPVDPTPVRVKKAGGKFVVVDKNGRRLDKGEALSSSTEAAGLAARVNATWAGAKKERVRRGGPAITEALERMQEGIFDRLRHPHGRAGRFSPTGQDLTAVSDESLRVHTREMASHSSVNAMRELDRANAETRRRETSRAQAEGMDEEAALYQTARGFKGFGKKATPAEVAVARAELKSRKVIKRIAEASEVTVKVAEKATGSKGGKAAPKKKPAPELPLTPVNTPPLEPPAPQIPAALGSLLDDFKGAKSGDTINLDGGRIVRTQKGFASHRHGGEAKVHATPHEAAQHLLTALQLERHEHAVKGHEQQHAARVSMHAEATMHAIDRAKAEVAEGFDSVKHPRQRGGLFASTGALKRELDKPDFGLVTHGPVSIHHNGGGRFQVEAGGEWVIAGHSKEAAQEAFRLARKHKGEKLSESVVLEEEIAIPRVGIPMHIHFDPRLHQRDRLGKFSEMLAKLERAPHNSVLHMPHGIAVRRAVTGLSVSGGGEARTLDSVHAAAGEALHRHAQAAVVEGGDFRHESGKLLEDLAQARRGAVSAQDAGGAFHLDTRMAEVRKERSRRFASTHKDSYRGRSDASERAFSATHGGDTPPEVGAQNFERAAEVARRSGGRARTGAQIDAIAKDALDFTNFYPREFDQDNRLVSHRPMGRKNEAVGGTPVRPGVSITRAADSDRGEIDVNGTDMTDGWHEGGRYEREEWASAYDEADGMAKRLGVELVDEVGQGSHRMHESPESAALRKKWEAHFARK